MKVVGTDPSRTFTVETGASPPVARRAEFRALMGDHTPLTPDQARTQLSAAWQRVTGSAVPARALALLQAQWALETGAGAAMYGNNFRGLKARAGGARFCTREGHGDSAVTIVSRFANALVNDGYYTASEPAYTAGLERWFAHFADGAPPPAGDPCMDLARQGLLRALDRTSND